MDDARPLPAGARDVLDFWFGPAPHAVARRVVPQGRRVRRADPRRASDERGRRCARRRVRRLVRDAARRARTRPAARPVHAQHLPRHAARVRRRRRARSRPRRRRGRRAGSTATLDRFERWFLYMPFEHSEDVDDAGALARAVRRALRGDGRSRSRSTGREKHAAVIRRFGRYPHRNAILGRASTPEEIAFLRRARLAVLTRRRPVHDRADPRTDPRAARAVLALTAALAQRVPMPLPLAADRGRRRAVVRAGARARRHRPGGVLRAVHPAAAVRRRLD